MAYTLPPLPYAYNALEPHIDARTMEIHHTKHHQAYITNVNNALAGHRARQPAGREADCRSHQGAGEHPRGRPQQRRRPCQPLALLDRHGPRRRRRTDRRPGRGHQRRLRQLRHSSRKQFAKAGATRFGSGWAWLTVAGGKLVVESTAQPGQPADGRPHSRSSASTSGNTPTTSTTRTAAPTTSPRSGTSSTGTKSLADLRKRPRSRKWGFQPPINSSPSRHRHSSSGR